MLIVLINKTAVFGNPLGDNIKGVLTLIIEGRFYLDKDMCTILISYDHPRYPGVDLARPYYLVSQSNHTHSLGSWLSQDKEHVLDTRMSSIDR